MSADRLSSKSGGRDICALQHIVLNLGLSFETANLVFVVKIAYLCHAVGVLCELRGLYAFIVGKWNLQSMLPFLILNIY